MKLTMILGLVLSFSLATQAAMDSATRDKLIEKFTKVYSQLADEEEAKINVTLRLADMYAEKGRDLANQELGEGCTLCNAGDESRNLALRYYNEAVGFLKEDRKASVLIQVGHLQELLGKENEAISSYKQVFGNTNNSRFISEANFSLGELYFKQRNFDQAANYFQKVVSQKEGGGRKGLAAYRKAWCSFNAGNYDLGTSELVAILKSPQLLTRGVDNGVISIDEEFKDEVTRDLVVFMVKRGYKSDDFDVIYKLGKTETKIDHLISFAEELERLGQVNDSLEVWAKLLAKIKDPVQKWSGQVRYANLLKTNKQVEASLKAYEKALSLGASQDDCVSDTCNEIRSRERAYVLDWHNSIKMKPTEELSKAYVIFNRFNKDRADFAFWGADVDLTLKKYKEAFSGYGKTLDLYSKTKAEDDKKQKDLNEMYESALLKRIEIAETEKIQGIAAIYNDYLEKSKQKDQASKVEYQLARLAYDNKENLKAHKLFRSIVLNTKATDKESDTLRKQAADLSLDALVLEKRDDLLIEAAEEYSKVIPENAPEYQAIVRKAVINQSLALAQDGNKDKKSLDLLKKADFSGATAEEKEIIIKNKIILAEKMGNISEASGYVDQYLALPNLPKADQQFAYTKKAWLSELMFDFKSALAATKKIEGIKEPQRTLQLALLTDLAGGDSTALFKEYIAKNPKASEAPEMALDLVKKSKTPWVELAAYDKLLRTTPVNWSKAVLATYEKDPSNEKLGAFLKWNESDKKFRIEFLQEQLLKPIIAQRSQALKSMTIDGSNQAKMAKDLQARIKEINAYEAFVADVIKSELWFGQVSVLDTLAKESKRFYEEVMALPMPEGLNEEEQMQYMNLLTQNAAPYQVKSEQITTKLNEVWNEKKAIKTVFANLDKQSKWYQESIVKAYEDISKIAPEDFSAFITAEVSKFKVSVDPTLVAKKSKKGSKSEASVPLERMMKVKSKVMSDPFDKGILAQLLEIEKSRKQDKMVIYLEQRMSKLEQLKDGTKGGVKK